MKRGRGKAKNITNGVQAAILYVKARHNDWSANRIREYLLKNYTRLNLKPDDIPVLRSIYNVIERNQPKLNDMQARVNTEEFQELESPWSIGACVKYNIPGDRIPDLLELKRIEAKVNLKIPHTSPSLSVSIRVARWFCWLYPFIEKQIEMLKPNSSAKQRLGYHFLIAGQYAEAERLSETLGKEYPDTSGLDRLYDGNLDTTEGWLRSFFPKDYKKAQQALENFTPLPKKELEPVLGKLTNQQVNLFNEWLYIMYLSQVHPRQSLKAHEEFFGKHPRMKPLTKKWIEWSPKKEGEK